MSNPILRDIQVGPIRLILGDARDVLPALGEPADLVVTDVPYKLSSGGNAHQSMGGIFSKDNYDNGGDLMDVVRWSEIGGPIYRACKPDVDAYIMTNDKNLFAAHGGFIGAGWKFHNLLAWNKVRATRNRWYMKDLEYTLYLWKGQADKSGINDCGSKQLFTFNNQNAKRTDHPTEKPVELMAHYILNSSNQGDLVLDPFMGSASTLLACLETGRRGVGVEVDEGHFETALKAVKDAYNAGLAA